MARLKVQGGGEKTEREKTEMVRGSRNRTRRSGEEDGREEGENGKSVGEDE